MFSQRWSTFTLLGVLAAAITAGFISGRLFQNARHAGAPFQNVPPPKVSLSNQPAPPVSADEAKPGDKSAENDCLALFARLSTPARDDALVAAIGRLAEKDPSRALKLARAAKNLRLRQRLLDAAFRGWGTTAPEAAADWILAQSSDDFDRTAAIASVFKGAANDPGAAVGFAQRLNREHPGQARDSGDALIYALAQNGNFSQAAEFAAAAEDSQLRGEWLAAAYGSWVSYQPQNAAASAMEIQDPAARADALNAVISGWGQVDPQSLADFAESDLPDGSQKTLALSQALDFWAAENPLAVADWINRFGPSIELDSGEAAIATQPQVMRQPAVAINWAEAITDPNLRSRTLAAIVETWQISDASAALAFARTSPDLLPDDRANLLSLPKP